MFTVTEAYKSLSIVLE